MPVKHGHKRSDYESPTYTSWKSMIARCTNAKHKSYPDYGAKNLQVCDRWKTFEAFLADMGERPEGLTLDRFPDRKGNYEPGNCRWATPKEQANNRKRPVPKKLTDRQVHQIKWLVEMGYSQAFAARAYGVSAVLVGLLVRGKARAVCSRQQS